MLKILFLKHTVIVENSWLQKAYRKHFSDLLRKDTEVVFDSLPPSTYEGAIPAGLVKYRQAEVLFERYFEALALKAEASGANAIVLGMSQDPGLAGIRAITSIPVVGYGETSFAIARENRIRFGVIGCVADLQEAIEARLTDEGVSHLCIGFRYVSDGVRCIAEALEHGEAAPLRSQMEGLAKELKDLGADALFMGEGLPNEVLWANNITELCGIPVFDSDGLAVLRAEYLALGLRNKQWGNGRQGYFTRRLPQEILGIIRSRLA